MIYSIVMKCFFVMLLIAYRYTFVLEMGKIMHEYEYDLDKMKNKIAVEMDKAGISQTKLASMLRVAQSQVSRNLSTSNSNSFTVPQLVKIAKNLNVSVDYLLDIETPEMEKEPTLLDMCTLVSKVLRASNKNRSFAAATGTETVKKEYGYQEQYHSIYFPEVSFTLDDAERTQSKNADILNQFIELMVKLNDLYHDGGIPDEMYERLVKSYLDDIKDGNVKCKNVADPW